MKNKVLIIFIGLVGVCLIAGGIYLNKNSEKELQKTPNNPSTNPSTEKTTNDYNFDVIKLVNKSESDNYLISPYSLEIALNMLKEGASGETYNQINKVVGSRTIPTFNVKDRISVANALFIKESYKNSIKKDFSAALANKYNSEILYDKFETPKVINDWASKKTYGMINNLLNKMDSEFVFGLANATAIDVDWSNQFECLSTQSEKFTNSKGTQNVEMMHNTYRGTKYISNDNEIGIVLPYNSYKSTGEVDYKNDPTSTQLEFIALMPTKLNITEYINSLSTEELNKKLDSMKTDKEVHLSLPRFEYNYEIKALINTLKSLGITDVFSSKTANFTKAIDKQVFISTALQKTYISLNEKGTKAAAVTFFGANETAGPPEKVETVDIVFNKPFMYIIRDTKTKEMLFFGVVQNPNIWKGSTCSNSK